MFPITWSRCKPWSTHIAKIIGPTWGPPGSCRPQMGPMLAPWTLLSGMPGWLVVKVIQGIQEPWSVWDPCSGRSYHFKVWFMGILHTRDNIRIVSHTSAYFYHNVQVDFMKTLQYEEMQSYRYHLNILGYARKKWREKVETFQGVTYPLWVSKWWKK